MRLNAPYIKVRRMHTWIDLIDAWKGPRKFADDLGLRYHTAYRMRERNSVHSTYWKDIVARAPQAGLDGVTMDLLASLKSGPLPDKAPAGTSGRRAYA